MKSSVWLLVVGMVVCQPSLVLALQDLDERVYCSCPDRSGISILDPDRLETQRILPNESAQLFAADRHCIFLIGAHVIRVLDRRTLIPKTTLDWNGYPRAEESRALLSPDGKKLIIGVIGWEGKPASGVHIIDLERLTSPIVLAAGQLDSGCIGVSPDGQRLYLPANPIQIVDSDSGKILQNVSLPEQACVTDIVAAGDHAFFAVIQVNRNSRLVAVDTESGRRAELDLPRPINRLAMTIPGTLYGLGSQSLVKIDVQQGKIVETLPYGGDVLSFDPDRQRLLIFSLTMKRLQIIDTRLNSLTRWIDFQQPTLGLSY